jgi:hypothetical protein
MLLAPCPDTSKQAHFFETDDEAARISSPRPCRLTMPATFTPSCTLRIDLEHIMNYVPLMFNLWGCIMIRAVVEEAAALASITLFVGMIVVWAQVLAVL